MDYFEHYFEYFLKLNLFESLKDQPNFQFLILIILLILSILNYTILPILKYLIKCYTKSEFHKINLLTKKIENGNFSSDSLFYMWFMYHQSDRSCVFDKMSHPFNELINSEIIEAGIMGIRATNERYFLSSLGKKLIDKNISFFNSLFEIPEKDLKCRYQNVLDEIIKNDTNFKKISSYFSDFSFIK